MIIDIRHGDCREVLKGFEDNFFDAVVTDPPYEYGFMNQRWDGTGIAFDVELWKEVFRVLKPGGHLVAFGADRRYHRLAVAVEDSGFELRTMGFWVSASSFPKSLDLSKAVEKYGDGMVERWRGWGTALKNAEPWCLARKPLEGRTLADNLLKHGTGGLYIDGCRIRYPEEEDPRTYTSGPGGNKERGVFDNGFTAAPDAWASSPQTLSELGRWPSAIVCSDEDMEGPVDGVAVIMDVEADGVLGGVLGPYTKHFRVGTQKDQAIVHALPDDLLMRLLPTAVVAPKASVGEREMGLEKFESKWVDPKRKEGSAGRNNPRAGAGRRGKRKNTHPTVKPIGLMRHLVRLVTPPGGKVLDPFCGVASTGVACVWEDKNFLGIEMMDTDEKPYVRIGQARCDYATRLHRTPEITHRVAKPKKKNEKQTDWGF